MRRYLGLCYLFCLLIVVPMVIYWMAIKETFVLSGLIQQQTLTLENLRYGQNKYTTQAMNTTESIGDGTLMTIIQREAEVLGVTVEKYTPYTTTSRGSARIVTAEIVLHGGYIGMVRLTNFIEASMNSCKLLSISFTTVTDKYSKEKKLRTTIIVQQITTK